MSLFGNISTQQQTQGTSGGLFSGINTNITGGGLFSNIQNKNNDNNTSSLFVNTNKPSSNDNNKPLFGNPSSGNSLFGAKVTTTNPTNNNPSNSLFGNISSTTNNQTSSGLFGNFQNNNNNPTNNTNPINAQPSGGLFGNQKPLFGASQTQGQEIKKEENTQKQGGGLFSNTQSIGGGGLFQNTNTSATPQTQQQKNNPLEIKPSGSIFGAPAPASLPKVENSLALNNNPAQISFGQNPKKENESKPQTQVQNTQTQSKEQSKTQTQTQTLFGTNINTQQKSNANLFSNANPLSKPKEDNNNDKKPSLNLNINPSNVQNQPQLNNNQQKPKENPETNVDNISSNNLYIKVPEKPFEISLSNSKELEEYEKNELMQKTNKEIIDDFKRMLDTQQIKFKQCVSNTRKFENKIFGVMEITNDNALMSEINGKNGEKIVERIDSINNRSKNLENIITHFNDKLGVNLSPYKDNIMNSDKLLLNQNDSEKFKFYENFAQISEKVYNIENALNEAEQNLNEKEKEINEKNKEDKEGIWIVRNKNKIFVNQYEMNNLFSECYDGLTNLKSMQDTIDKNYEILKEKVMKQNVNYIDRDINKNYYNNLYK